MKVTIEVELSSGGVVKLQGDGLQYDDVALVLGWFAHAARSAYDGTAAGNEFRES